MCSGRMGPDTLTIFPIPGHGMRTFFHRHAMICYGNSYDALSVFRLAQVHVPCKIHLDNECHKRCGKYHPLIPECPPNESQAHRIHISEITIHRKISNEDGT